MIINGGDAFLDAYTAQKGDGRDVITGINLDRSGPLICPMKIIVNRNSGCREHMGAKS